jgi:hypothetical protein
MKALGPQRSRMVLCFLLVALFVAALFVATHMKAGMGVVFFLLLGIHALYNLTSDPN